MIEVKACLFTDLLFEGGYRYRLELSMPTFGGNYVRTERELHPQEFLNQSLFDLVFENLKSTLLQEWDVITKSKEHVDKRLSDLRDVK